MKRLACGFALVLVLAGCGGETSGTRSVSASGFSPLNAPFHYEGWLLQTDNSNVTRWVSFGKFNVDAQGNLVKLAGGPFEIESYGPNRGSTTYAKISIENSQVNSSPSVSTLLAGPVTLGESPLSATDVQAFGTNFVGATGTFRLETPTASPVNTNGLSGAWFRNSALGASLNLPTLPSGWRYQAWATIGTVTVSMGRFTAVTGADSGNPHKGPGVAPLVPGEDFLAAAPGGLSFPLTGTTTPTSLIGQSIFVTVEAEPDPAVTPSQYVILRGVAASGATVGSSVVMSNQASGKFPTFSLTVF